MVSFWKEVLASPRGYRRLLRAAPRYEELLDHRSPTLSPLYTNYISIFLYFNLLSQRLVVTPKGEHCHCRGQPGTDGKECTMRDVDYLWPWHCLKCSQGSMPCMVVLRSCRERLKVQSYNFQQERPWALCGSLACPMSCFQLLSGLWSKLYTGGSRRKVHTSGHWPMHHPGGFRIYCEHVCL